MSVGGRERFGSWRKVSSTFLPSPSPSLLSRAIQVSFALHLILQLAPLEPNPRRTVPICITDPKVKKPPRRPFVPRRFRRTFPFEVLGIIATFCDIPTLRNLALRSSQLLALAGPLIMTEVELPTYSRLARLFRPRVRRVFFLVWIRLRCLTGSRLTLSLLFLLYLLSEERPKPQTQSNLAGTTPNPLGRRDGTHPTRLLLQPNIRLSTIRRRNLHPTPSSHYPHQPSHPRLLLRPSSSPLQPCPHHPPLPPQPRAPHHSTLQRTRR